MRARPSRVLCLGAWLAALLVGAAGKALAAARTEMVAMRDGVELATTVHLPENPGPFPVILVRTPYNKDAAAGVGTDGAKRGYAVVVQDTRGRFGSRGENLPFDADGWSDHCDGVDTVEWIHRQPWCNGKIGTWGGSAVGVTQLLLAGARADRITCQHITVGAPSLYRDAVYPGGVFKKAMIEDWLRVSQFSTNALKRWVSHPLHDEYWHGLELDRRYRNVNAPAVHIGGWFDIFAQGTIDAFAGYQRRGGPLARGRQKLVIGPWTHGVLQEKAGDLAFPGGKRPPWNVHDAWRWFDFHLKNADNGVDRQPAVTYYVMGDVTDTNAPGNLWRAADAWPPVPAKETKLYLRSDRALSWSQPSSETSLSYTYNPREPTPTVGGCQLTLPAGPKDQRGIENRADVLVFTSPPLTAPVEVTGRVRVELWASTDAPDTDFFASMCDVYPDQRSFNICEGRLRARFRKSFDEEKLLKPGKPYRFDLDLGSTSIIFNRGHRLRVLVTSSSSPGFDPNPNTGTPFRSDDRVAIAHQTVYVDARRPSHILLPLVTGTR